MTKVNKELKTTVMIGLGVLITGCIATFILISTRSIYNSNSNINKNFDNITILYK